MYPDPDRKRVFGLVDVIVIATTVSAIAYTWLNVSEVLVYKWNWNFLPQVLFIREEGHWWRPNVLLEGLFTTLRLSFWSMVLASVLGLLLGIMATLDRLLPRLIAVSYVGLIRNIPPLVFIFVFYFFISSQIIPALGVDVWARELGDGGRQAMGVLLGPPELLENLISGVVCLAMFEAAYIAEIIRAGIRSVPEGQTEAGQSMGLKPYQVFRLIVIPQALRAVAPPMANQFILLVKNSAIVSLISVQELTFIGSEIAISTGRRFETWIVVAGMYFVVCFTLARWFSRLERQARQKYER